MTYDIKMLLRNNRLSDDDRMDMRLLERYIITQRALWVQKKLSGSIKPDKAFIQDLGTVVLDLVDPSEATGFDTNATVLRTNATIPRRISNGSFDGITRVGPVNKVSANYLYVPYDRARWAGGGYFNSNAIVTTLLNDYMYVLSRSQGDYYKYLAYINIQGVFEDPRDVSSFTYSSGDACFSEDGEYPITEALWTYIRGEIVKNNFGILTSVLSDVKQDADSAVTDKA
jgi:hypothetical protein